MKTIPRATFALLVGIGFGLGGCASPNIVLQPTLPAVPSSSAPETLGTVSLAVSGTERNPQGSRYEEKGDKTLIGNSESLGVHLSDFWVQEPPHMFVQRLLDDDLRAWGFKVSADNEKNQLHGRVNAFSLKSRAISAIEFQADGVIDVDLEVSRADGTQLYKGHYVGTCTHRTATEIPNKENMEKLFNRCVGELQTHLQEDGNLRTALSSN
jgi:uncharacterized lipoprotein YajG